MNKGLIGLDAASDQGLHCQRKHHLGIPSEQRVNWPVITLYAGNIKIKKIYGTAIIL